VESHSANLIEVDVRAKNITVDKCCVVSYGKGGTYDTTKVLDGRQPCAPEVRILRVPSTCHLSCGETVSLEIHPDFRNEDIVAIEPRTTAPWLQPFVANVLDHTVRYSGCYSGASGQFQFSINIGKSLPPQRKGRIPIYSNANKVALQNKFDELHSQ
jgi:hypothetical protein